MGKDEEVWVDPSPSKGIDNVNHPSHYTQYKGLEVIDLAEQMNFCRGNVVKYLCRAGFKSPETEIEDLEKARWYLDKEINRLKDERHRHKIKGHLAAGGTVITNDDLGETPNLQNWS